MGYECVVNYDYAWNQVRDDNDYITSLMTIEKKNVIVIKDEIKSKGKGIAL